MFERFREFEKFGDGIPVAAGEGRIHGFFEPGPGELGPADTVAKVNIKFPALKVKFFPASVELQYIFARKFRGFRSEKRDEELRGFNAMSTDKRISGDDVAHFGASTKDDVRRETEITLDGVLDTLGEHREVGFTAEKDDIAALHVGSRRLQLEGFAESAKGIHLDFIATADVDAAEHADYGGHGGGSITREWSR